MKYLAAWTIVLSISAVALGLAWRAFASARDAAATQLNRREALLAQLRELERIRPVAAQWQDRKRPASNLAALLGETLAACGIPASALANVSPQPEAAAHGGAAAPRLKRQRATLMLVPVTLPQLGAFFEAWRTREPRWTVASIDLSPEPAPRQGETAPGGDLPLRAALTLDTLYLDDPKGDRK